ncbi:putative RNA-binding protein [Histomonas meleagridis]|uniref:putative RNA-binding protein n=1 Tax=Histomonas meleagridis TaxID=135588 RepID=UPI00355A278F|nr:putative RNA-binding protein [Histomonas meleagridis]KAH0800724.1 putative RNA-binding protein [Histomonas meleagridis]
MQYPKPNAPNLARPPPGGYPYPPPQYNVPYPPQPYQYQNQYQNQYSQIPRPQTSPSNQANQPSQSSNYQRIPIHTAFFSNIQYNVPYETFKEFAEKYGEIANIYSLIQKKGIAFVTYFNIKSAQKAVEQADNQLLMGRPVKTNFGKKSSNPQTNPRFTCSALLVRTAIGSKLTLKQVQMEMSKFGEIYATAVLEPTLFYIKFCDIRDAQKAINGKHLMNFNGENVSIDFKLDDEDIDATLSQPQQPMPNYPYGYPPQQNMQYQQIPQQPMGNQFRAGQQSNPYGAPQQYYGAPQQPMRQPSNTRTDDKFKFLDFLGH